MFVCVCFIEKNMGTSVKYGKMLSADWLIPMERSIFLSHGNDLHLMVSVSVEQR